MIFPKLLHVYGGLFAFVLFSGGGRADVKEDAFKKMLRERISCFMVNTAAKIYRINVENNMYDKNIIFSPMDLYATTALAYLGTTKDGIRQQLNKVLGIKTLEKFLELNPEHLPLIRKRKAEAKLRKNLGDFNNELRTDEDDDQQHYYDLVNEQLGNMVRNTLKTKTADIRSGKAMFVDEKYTVKTTYLQTAKLYYDVVVKRTDFEKKPKESTKKINSFIKDQTDDKISDFFDKPVTATTKSILSSSLTMVAGWKKLFQPDDSYETAFHTREAECDDCDDTDICVMMNQGEIPYYVDSKVSAIALPTANSQIRMYYVIPQENQTLSGIISRPNKNFVKKIIDGVAPRLIVYHVPKMTFRGEIDQLDIFRLSGLNNISLDGVADRLTLSIFQQKILLEINEEGIGGCPLRRSKKMPLMHKSVDNRALEFVADKPFLFFIYNSRTKIFLFYGAVFKPTRYTDF